MAMSSLDAELQGFLTVGLDYVRQHPDVCQEIFSSWLAPHMAKLYGQKAINQVKAWIAQNEIPTVLSFGLEGMKMPGLSVHLAQEQERVEAAALSDQATMIDNLVDQPIVIPSFVPLKTKIATDPGGASTVTVTVSTVVDLSALVPGMVLVDAKNEEYLVTAPITDNSFTVLQEGGTINARSLYVKAGPGEINEQLRGASMRSMAHVDIGIHANGDYQVVLWLYYVIQWVFARFKLEMEERGIQLASFSGSEFNRESKYLAQNVYSRWYRYTAQVSIEWTEPWATAVSTIQTITEGSNSVDPTDTFQLTESEE